MVLMLAILVAAAGLAIPNTFPENPIAREMNRGAAVYRQKKGIERTLFEDRVALSRWFTGSIKVDTDQAIYLSPAMVSRWFGYLAEKEMWPQSEVTQRWNNARTLLNGKLTFIAELYALPKQSDFLELVEGANSKPETALKSRFLARIPLESQLDLNQPGELLEVARSHRMDASRIESRVLRGHSLGAVNRWPWWTIFANTRDFRTEFSLPTPTEYEAVVGDYLRVISLVQFDYPEDMGSSRELEFRVFAPGKELVATFAFAND